MKYIFFKVLKKYQYLLGIYLLLLLEICIGVVFITLALNYYFFGQQEKQKIESELQRKELVLQAEPKENISTPFEMDEEDVLELDRLVGNKIECITIIHKVVFSGNKAHENDYIFTNHASQYDKKTYKVFPMEELFKSEEGECVYSGVLIGKDVASQEMIEKILNYLQDKYEQAYSFYFINESFQKQYTVEYLAMVPGYFGKVAMILMFVMTIGFTGVMQLFFYKRKKELAICAACGAKLRDLEKEIIIEISGICIVGGLAGMLIGNVITKTVDFGLPVQVSIKMLVSIILALFSLILFLSSLLIVKIRNNTIYSLLVQTEK